LLLLYYNRLKILFKKYIFFGEHHSATYIFHHFSLNETRLGGEIDPGHRIASKILLAAKSGQK